MIFHPTVIAQYAAALFIGLMVLYAAVHALRIIIRWDISSGSELQLSLERRTYLISTILSYVFAFELMTFFLYIYSADQLHTMFVGAMCAAGTLKVNDYGYPALYLKIVNFLLAGLWLIMNYVDNKAYDYPLIKRKYALLLIIAPLVWLEIFIQTRYFLLLRPDIITSCCGSLFSSQNAGVVSDLIALPPVIMMMVFYLSVVSVLAAGSFFWVTRKGGRLFGFLCTVYFVIAILSILSFISPYFYELPTHHCPFCILQGEYGYIGYPLYFALLGGMVTGLGAAMMTSFQHIESLAVIIPRLQTRFTVIALVLVVVFAGIVTLRIVTTNFVLLV